jgi:chlorobactene glucosyltransferase
MILLVSILLGLIILEVIDAYLPLSWLKKFLTVINLIAVSTLSISILVIKPSIWSAVLCYFSIFRVINLFKLYDSRKQIDFLRSSTIRSSLMLGLFQLVDILIAYSADYLKINYQDRWAILVIIDLCLVLIVLISLIRSLSKTQPKLVKDFIEDKKLPSLTVAIPARNETKELEECLMSVIASDYPKLEILVLDDCSQEKRTPEIIRQFAHDGVRFLAGTVPNDSWTAKNFAYQQLSDQASGQIILFCGVDIRFERQSIRHMVELKIKKNKKMISFMPNNVLSSYKFKRLLIQPARYLWEMGLPRRFFKKPPVLSSCWLIDSSLLRSVGSFKSASRSIEPERYFAKKAINQKDGYSFISSGNLFGLISNKSFEEQLETGIRTRYPLLKQRLENVSLISLVEAVIFVLPVGLLIYEIIRLDIFLIVISGICYLLTNVLLYQITKLTYSKNLLLSLICAPFVFGYDIGLCFYSMWRYEFSHVDWKGRNVCIPVMQLVNTNRSTLN